MELEPEATDWAAAVTGDGEAFGRVFDRHKDRVTRHAHRLVENRDDADDVVAVAFLEAWRRRSAVRLVDGSTLPWLLVTAGHAAANLRRSRRRYRALLAKLPTASTGPDPAALVESASVTLPLHKLGEKDRQVIALVVIEGLSEQETAAVLGVPAGTVKSRLSRARSRLAALVRSHHPELTEGHARQAEGGTSA
jgi:RNA polymerase sigma factor (sigma-70 family)